MLFFREKYFRSLWIGCTIAFLHQVNGQNPGFQFAPYLDMTSEIISNSRIAILICVVILAFFSPLILQKYGRKSIFMCGFLFWCLSNIIIFQILDEDIDCNKCSYKTTINSLLYISLSTFVIVHAFCFSPVLWVYLAETLPPRALGI